MTDNEKENIINDLKALTKDYFNALKEVLEKNGLVYATEQKTMIMHTPFDGHMPTIDNDMLEDLCLDLTNHPDTVIYDLHEKSYVNKKIAEYEEYHSPKNRILRHMSEISRLTEKYHVTDDDLKSN